jgi:two-component system, sensor histidine kinase
VNRPKTNIEADLRLREALRFVAANTLQSVIASTLVAAAMVFLMRHSLHTSAALIWLSALVGIGVLRVHQRVRVQTALSEQRATARHLQQFAVLAFMTGLTWAGALWMLRPNTDSYLHAVVLLACAAIGAGGAFASLASLRTAFAIFWPPMLALVVFGLLDGRSFYLVVGVVSLPLSLLLARMVVVLNRQFIEQVELRERNAELLLALQQRTADAEAANEAKSRFLVAASHDLRQPMHAIAIRSRALLEQPLAGDVRHMAERLDQSVVAMQSLFDALLDISKLDAGNVQPTLAPFSLQTLFAALRDGYADIAVQQGIQLNVQPTSLWVNSDALLLERILRQLLDNAVRHAGPCSVILRAEARNDEVVIEVRDTGKGIAQDQQSNIFKEFVQLNNPERDRRKGLGLGLAIVQRIAQQLGHRLELQSAGGAGASFRIFLPMAQADSPVAESAAENPLPAPDTAQPALPDAVPDGPACIALLDDDPDVLEAMSLLLTHWQYQVIAATHSPELMQALLSNERAPDLLICDYRLAEKLNGREVIENLRRHYVRPLPALLITGDLRALDAAGDGGDVTVLRKPVPPSTLREQVEKHIARPAPGG